MTDLINEEETHEVADNNVNINELYQKYRNILDGLDNKDKTINNIINLDVIINHIVEHYSTLESNVRAWQAYIAFFLLSKKDNKKTHDEIFKLIGDFVTYYNENYNIYLEDIALYKSEYSRDIQFIKNFINLNNG